MGFIDNNFSIYDRHVNNLDGFNKKIFTKSMKHALKNADVIFIMSPLNEFKKLNNNYETDLLNSRLIIDPFRIINKKEIYNKKGYFYN